MHFPRMGWQTALSFFIALTTLSPGFGGNLPDPCSLAENPYPNCFHPRITPTIRTILVHYGDHVKEYDFEAAKKLYVERFNQEMRGIVDLVVLDTVVIPLKAMDRNLAEVASLVGGSDPRKKTKDRLERLWYYYHSDPDQLIREISALLLETGHRSALEEADTVLVISEPQFEALGFASGAYGITEQPSEIAWALSDGGRTEWQTSPRLVDELLHETGHLLGLRHASEQCFRNTSPPTDSAACCAKSEGANDVMSYCRKRTKVENTFYYGFTSCTKKFIAEHTVPNMLEGGPRRFQDAACH